MALARDWANIKATTEMAAKLVKVSEIVELATCQASDSDLEKYLLKIGMNVAETEPMTKI